MTSIVATPAAHQALFFAFGAVLSAVSYLVGRFVIAKQLYFPIATWRVGIVILALELLYFIWRWGFVLLTDPWRIFEGNALVESITFMALILLCAMVGYDHANIRVRKLMREFARDPLMQPVIKGEAHGANAATRD